MTGSPIRPFFKLIRVSLAGLAGASLLVLALSLIDLFVVAFILNGAELFKYLGLTEAQGASQSGEFLIYAACGVLAARIALSWGQSYALNSCLSLLMRNALEMALRRYQSMYRNILQREVYDTLLLSPRDILLDGVRYSSLCLVDCVLLLYPITIVGGSILLIGINGAAAAAVVVATIAGFLLLTQIFRSSAKNASVTDSLLQKSVLLSSSIEDEFNRRLATATHWGGSIKSAASDFRRYYFRRRMLSVTNETLFGSILVLIFFPLTAILFGFGSIAPSETAIQQIAIVAIACGMSFKRVVGLVADIQALTPLTSYWTSHLRTTSGNDPCVGISFEIVKSAEQNVLNDIIVVAVPNYSEFFVPLYERLVADFFDVKTSENEKVLFSRFLITPYDSVPDSIDVNFNTTILRCVTDDMEFTKGHDARNNTDLL